MKTLSLLVLTLIVLASCKTKFPDDTPACIVTKAEQGDATNFVDYKYVYKYVKKTGQGITAPGLTYYRFVADAELQYDELVDQGCNLICNPQRGVFSGLTGDCATPLFNDPQEWTLIWTNPNKK
jgi:hypothetical protein